MDRVDRPVIPRQALTRRSFLMYAGALGVSAPALVYLLEACSTGSQATKAGGTLKIGTSDNFADFNPHREPFGNFLFINQLYGAPTRDNLQPDSGSPQLWDATAVTVGPDSSYVDIKVRSGVKFHGGDPLNADAVVASVNHAADPALSDQSSLWTPILDKATATDKTTARISFKKPIADRLIKEMVSRLSLISPSILAKGKDSLLTAADGTGAFKLVSYSQGNKAVLKKNPDFWHSGLPLFDGIEYTFFSDPTAMVSALQSGAVDMITNAPYQVIAQLKNDFTIVPGPLGLTFTVDVSCKPGMPFARLAARQALHRLINKQRFNDEVLFGTGKPAVVLLNEDSIGYDPSFATQFTYDPQAAKQQFAALGMLNNSKPIEMLQLQGILPTLGALSAQVAEEMNAIGLNTKLIPLDISVYAKRFYSDGDYQMATNFIGRANRYPSMLAAGNTGTETGNNSCWPDKKPPQNYIDAVNNTIYATAPADQKKWALEMQRIWLEGSWDLSVAYQRIQYVFKKSDTGFENSRDDWIILDGMHA